MNTLEQLSDSVLIDSYIRAINYGLDNEFIRILHTELMRREISTQSSLYEIGGINYQ